MFMKLLLTTFLALTLNGIDLEKRILLDGKIEMLIPKDFRWMTEEELKIKYAQTARAPKLVLTDDSMNVNVAFSHTSSPIDDVTLPMFQRKMKEIMEQTYPAAEWRSEGMKKINGKQFGYLKLIAERADKSYNYMILTELEGKLLIISFNCAERLITEWEPIAEQIMSSIIVK